jgi:hypothetical protein
VFEETGPIPLTNTSNSNCGFGLQMSSAGSADSASTFKLQASGAACSIYYITHNITRIKFNKYTGVCNTMPVQCGQRSWLLAIISSLTAATCRQNPPITLESCKVFAFSGSFSALIKTPLYFKKKLEKLYL